MTTNHHADLTLSGARSHALSGLAEHWPQESLGLVEEKTFECEVGWVFTVDTSGGADNDAARRRAAIGDLPDHVVQSRGMV